MSLISVIPDYEPKTDEKLMIKINLNIRDLQSKYPHGCKCCGNTYLPRRYSTMIASHFNTKKHDKLCIEPSNILLKNDYGNSINIIEAFDNKCKENRKLKKLNNEYKSQLDKLNNEYKSLIRYDNLIDLN